MINYKLAHNPKQYKAVIVSDKNNSIVIDTKIAEFKQNQNTFYAEWLIKFIGYSWVNILIDTIKGLQVINNVLYIEIK